MRARLSSVVVLLFSLTLGTRSLLAQAAAPTPDENPEGNTGALKAQVTTGGSYDAHAGNATRMVNDLHVPGALGIYGLDFTRYWNSVHNDETNLAAELPVDFGASGWSHSWRWAAVYDEEWPDTGASPAPHIWVTSITITFPDGHAAKFKISRTDAHNPPFGADPRVGPPYYANRGERDWPSLGETAHDYLAGMAQDGSEFWLYRADGGSVHFVGTNGPNPNGGYYTWGYRATEVFDPHGFRTTLTYQAGFLTRVEQEGGRWLTVTWGTLSDGTPVISRVETGGDAGSQYVTYYYKNFVGLYALHMVKYANQPAPGQTVSALYTYDSVFPGSLPVLKWADDPHYSGAMTKIAYDYGGGYCPGLSQPPPTPPPSFYDSVNFTPETIAAEKSGETGEVVARFQSGCGGERLDYNGFGGVRKLYFGHSANDPQIACAGYMLTKATDFGLSTGVVPGLPFRRQRGPEPGKAWDGRGIETDFSYADGSGSPSEIRHVVDGSSSTYDRIHQGNSADPDTSRIRNPHHHWLFSKKDENNNVTVYTRDSRRRVTQISYYKGPAQGNPVAVESYTYNQWNQVETHTLPSGAVQHYEYDGSHRLEREYNSWDIAISPSDYKFYTYYGPGNHPEWTDLVEMVIDGRARVSGAPFTVKMTYNGRQQVMSVEYPSTGGASNPTVRYEYDKYGNRITITDEMGHRKEYTYDAYRRCTSYLEWLFAPAWNGNGTVFSRRWDWIYDRVIDFGPPVGVYPTPYPASAHTSKEWRIQIEPEFNGDHHRRATARIFDVNNRMLSEQTGLIQLPTESLGTLHSVQGVTETHSVTYDPNGQKSSSTDPLNRVTTYGYDLRNRLETTTEPKRENQQAYPVTRLEYDAAGNKKKVTFPDMKTQRWENYDAFGQASQFFDERNNVTDLTYQWGPMKKLATVRTYRERDNPPGGTETQETNFDYDQMGRLLSTHFPDTSTEVTTYKFGQIETYKTRRDEQKIIDVYDARGREKHHYWLKANGTLDPATPAISQVWDDASRMIRIWNNFSIIDYTYDEAGQVLTEGTTVTGDTAVREVRYCRYPNGDVSQITYPNGSTVVNRFYTPRGQLESVGWGIGATSYVYLRDGRVDYQARTNGVTTSYGYDGRGMVGSVRHSKDGHDLAYREYWRDDRDRILGWKRGTDNHYNGMEDGRGNRYHYDDEGQLDLASYRIENPAGTTGVAQRSDIFNYDKMGNRMGSNYVASRGSMTFTRKDNGLNQYRRWWPYSDTNYDDDVGGDWGAPGHANGVLMQDGWITAGFNALNQPISMWSPMYPGGSSAQWMWFGYDPLGRCVKRWVGPLAGTPPNQHAPPANTNPATYYYYDGWNLIQEGPSGGPASRVYVHGGRMDEIVASQAGGEWSHHHYDAQGNCIMLTDTGGLIREQYDYDAFGLPYFYNFHGDRLGGTNRWGNRFLFTGREWLQDLKVYDYRARMYQPELGRFLQPDPKEFEAGDYNLYRYCHNDPVNKSDPTGLLSLTSSGGGDWDWFNGRVALEQTALLASMRETAGRSVGFIGLARAVDAARAAAGEDARDSAKVDPVPMEPERMSPNEITKQPYPNVNRNTKSFTRKVPYPARGYRNAFTGKIQVTVPVGIQSVLPNTTTEYDGAEASQRTRAIQSIYKANPALAKLAAQGFHDVESAKRDAYDTVWKVIGQENVRNIIETDVNQRP